MSDMAHDDFSRTTTPYYDHNHHGSYYSTHKEAVLNLSRAPSAKPPARSIFEETAEEPSLPANGGEPTSSPRYYNNISNIYSNLYRPSTSLTRLARSQSYREGINRRPWDNDTTTHRDYRYHPSELSEARARPIRPRVHLNIATSGPRDFSPEKRESYHPYRNDEVMSARPPLHFRPDSGVLKYPGRISDRTEIRDEYSSPKSRMGRQSLSRYSRGELDLDSGRTSRLSNDARFASGTTTSSSYRGISSSLGDLRSLSPVRRPWSSSLRTGYDERFRDQVTSKEHYKSPAVDYYNFRQMPNIRQSLVPVPLGGVSHGLDADNGPQVHMRSDTTYTSTICDNIKYSGLKPKRRFDPTIKKPDNLGLDWM